MIYSSQELPSDRFDSHELLELIEVVVFDKKDDFKLMLELALQGNEVAWTRLFETYEPGLRRDANELLGPLLRSEADVEDLVQSVHWSLLSGLRLGKIEVDSATALLAIGRTILKRKIARIWRTLERRKRISNQVGEKFERTSKLDDVVQSVSDPIHQVSADEQFERLCKIMTRTERRLIELRMLGYSTAGAAREMGCDSECLRVTLARLRRKLKQSGLLADFSTIPTRPETQVNTSDS